MFAYTNFTLLFFFFILASFQANAKDPSYVYKYCPYTTLYRRHSTYSANVRTLLSSLSSPNASYAFGFQNATAGQVPNKVTGYFLCHGDLSPEDCRSCVLFAVKDIKTQCPNEKDIIIYYDVCTLRYSHRNILSTLDFEGEYVLMNSQNVTSNQLDRFMDVLLSTMNQAVDVAANSFRKFEVKKVNLTSTDAIYVMVQCTPILTRLQCNNCLQKILSQILSTSIGGKMLYSSCLARYEFYPFFNVSAIQIPLPPSQPPSPVPPRPNDAGKGGHSTVIIVAVAVFIAVSALLLIAGCCFLAKRGRKSYDPAAGDDKDDIRAAASLQLDFRAIKIATENFSESKKLGEGGFGEVYKGSLTDGTEVAVKRLSQSSGQGEREFKNEVVVVAKLQHRNLVKLLGFCLEGEERILVYEFVPNKSLDHFIFDPTTESQVDWTIRYKIIGGIARGILYLHQDSRLTIIHRDLKASNILIDANMNPKIADFGMAKIFGMDQTQSNTSRIVGTFGYMAPEYAMHGQFSMKSDVYSFGVLVLEIISGKKNCSFDLIEDGVSDLVTYAWRLWRNGSPLDIVDRAMGDNYERSKVIRCIHIGLLCVQEDLTLRPTMSTIIFMFTSDTVDLPVPEKPGFCFRSTQQQEPVANVTDSNKSISKSYSCSLDDASTTELHPR